MSFHGAAGCITGSKHLLQLDTGESVLLDCGLFQGMGKETLVLNHSWKLDAAAIDFLLLSHAHIDHSGLIPLLVKRGFRGRILCTPATHDLCKVMLLDCARIQEEDVYFINKKYRRFGQPLVKPLYTEEDALAAFAFFEEVGYDTPTALSKHITATFFDAGHILGSASVHVRIREGKKSHSLLFSGDVGRYQNKIITPPARIPQVDVLLLESTYANRSHFTPQVKKPILLDWIERVCVRRRGNLVIPAFSLGRTQELLFELNKLAVHHQLPDVKYYVDSPMSIQITEIFRKYQHMLNAQTQKVIVQDSDAHPFSFPGLQDIQSVDESKALRYSKEPFVVIASSGMGDAGRVKHHIANHIQHSKHAILMSGYASPSSLCGKLMSGHREVSIFGVDYQIHAEIGIIPGMSAHADHEQLLQFVADQDPLHLKHIFLVHGEEEGQQYMQEVLREKGFLRVDAPQLGEQVII